MTNSSFDEDAMMRGFGRFMGLFDEEDDEDDDDEEFDPRYHVEEEEEYISIPEFMAGAAPWVRNGPSHMRPFRTVRDLQRIRSGRPPSRRRSNPSEVIDLTLDDDDDDDIVNIGLRPLVPRYDNDKNC